MRLPDQKWLLWILLVLGGSLWIINWWAGRPLFIDEANVARNLYDRSFGDLFRPLDHQQYAPPLYLVLAKGCGELFGYGERALRLPALLGGLLAVIGLLRAGKVLRLGYWSLLPLGLLFVNPTVLRYVGEVKPYALDLGIAAVLLALALERKLSLWAWVLIGAVLPWLSLPSVFVLAAIGGYFLMSVEGKLIPRWVAIAVAWLLSFAFLYVTVLRPAIGSEYLTDFHRSYFFPVVENGKYAWFRAASLILAQPRLAFGYTTFSIILGGFCCVVALHRQRQLTTVLLVAPILIVFVVSALEKYSLITRLLLFTLPGWWLLATLGARELAEVLRSRKPRLPFLVGAAWLVALTGTNVLRHYFAPLQFSGSRELTTQLEDGYTPLLFRSALPAYDYYHRIHPRLRQPDFVTPERANLTQEEPAGRYVVLYDVLTEKRFYANIRRDAKWAADNGATEIRTVDFLHAKALYVTFPEEE